MGYSDGKISDEAYIDWTGKILRNKYLLIKKLGHGSYASVWMTFNFISKKFYAIKIFHIKESGSSVAEEKYFKLFKSEYTVEMYESFAIDKNNEPNEKDKYDEELFDEKIFVMHALLLN